MQSKSQDAKVSMPRQVMQESSSSKRAWERGKLYEKPAQNY